MMGYFGVCSMYWSGTPSHWQALKSKKQSLQINTPYCNKGVFALANRFLELLYPRCCGDVGMWEHSVSCSLHCFHSFKSGVCSLGQRVILMLSGEQGQRFFLAIVELLDGWGRCLGLQQNSYCLCLGTEESLCFVLLRLSLHPPHKSHEKSLLINII